MKSYNVTFRSNVTESRSEIDRLDFPVTALAGTLGGSLVPLLPRGVARLGRFTWLAASGERARFIRRWDHDARGHRPTGSRRGTRLTCTGARRINLRAGRASDGPGRVVVCQLADARARGVAPTHDGQICSAFMIN
jgi:hypothetical protein